MSGATCEVCDAAAAIEEGRNAYAIARLAQPGAVLRELRDSNIEIEREFAEG